jgi:hypothetical protein
MNCRRLEPIATANGRHFQMQRCVLRMSAIFQEILFRLVRGSDLSKDILGMPFPEMGAESALSVFNVQHVIPPAK